MSTQKTIDWPQFIRTLKKIIKDFPIPYVTKLSRDQKGKQTRAYAILASTIISLRTKDKVTEEASERLLAKAPSLTKLKSLSVEQIEKLIYPSGFYRNKAKQLKQIAITLLSDNEGIVPNNIEKLIKLPGVGRKTANLVMTEGFDSYGICVDIHVHRIFNRLGFIETKEPDETEFVLREILPKKYWKEINFWLVTFGQNHCKPVSPKCDTCLLKNNCTFFCQSVAAKKSA